MEGTSIMMTRTQFIFQMILAYGRRYPGIRAKTVMPMAATTYRDFIEREGIEYGDQRYAWDKAAAETLVEEFENC